MTQGHELLMFVCCMCRAPATACPQCVNTIAIDPETGIPPDTARGDNGEAITIVPTEEVKARSEQQPLCDECIEKSIAMRPSRMFLTSEERHKRFHKGV